MLQSITQNTHKKMVICMYISGCCLHTFKNAKKANQTTTTNKNRWGFLRENSRFSLLDSATSEWGRGGLWREGVPWPNRTSRAANKIQSRFIFSSKSILYFHYTLIHITYLSTLVQFEFKEFRFMGKLKFFQIFIQKTTSDLNYVLPKIGIWEPNWFHVDYFPNQSTFCWMDIRLMTSILASEVDFHRISNSALFECSVVFEKTLC